MTAIQPNPTASTELVAVPCAILRGGTSKGVFLPASAVPSDTQARERFLLALMGSPDVRQIDGLGGADLLTSKVAIVGPATRADADVDYTFAQVSIDRPEVHFDMNCGNISAAVGVYAVEKGLVTATEPVTRVRIHNRNTGTILVADVPVKGAHARVDGDYQIDGVPGSGAAIRMDYRLTTGGATGALLPTGRPQDPVVVPGVGTVAVSVVDIANLCFFVRAEELGLDAHSMPERPTPAVLERTDKLQRAVARLLGLPEGRLTPIPVIVAPPHDFLALTVGERVSADTVDIVAEVIGGQPLTLHKAFPGTAGITLAVATRIPGTVAFAAASQGDAPTVRIGHPSGRMEVDVRVSVKDRSVSVEEASYYRTARLIMEGTAYLRRDRL